jgi:peptidoglycan/LPS O-acetylase OafA/YrhL
MIVGMDPTPIAPTWLVLPLALIAIVIQAGYLIALKEVSKDRMPPSRKRIRTASGWMSIIAIPLTAYGFGIATPNEPGIFALVWLVVISLIGAILMLAGLDAINTMRLHRHTNARLSSEFHEALRTDMSESMDDPEGSHNEST